VAVGGSQSDTAGGCCDGSAGEDLRCDGFGQQGLDHGGSPRGGRELGSVGPELRQCRHFGSGLARCRRRGSGSEQPAERVVASVVLVEDRACPASGESRIRVCAH